MRMRFRIQNDCGELEGAPCALTARSPARATATARRQR